MEKPYWRYVVMTCHVEGNMHPHRIEAHHKSVWYFHTLGEAKDFIDATNDRGIYRIYEAV